MSGLVGHRGLLLTGGASVAEAATLHAALKSWWPLDENNAGISTFSDIHASNHLTFRDGGSTNNTAAISTPTAKQGRAAALGVVDDRCLYVPRSNTALDLPDASFSFGGWFWVNQAAATAAFIMGRVGSAATTIQAYLGLESDATLRAYCSSDGAVSGRVGTAGFSSSVWSGSEFQLIVLTLDRAADQLEIRYRRPGYSSGALQKQTVAFSSALYTTSSTANFTISEGLSGDSTFFASNRCGVSIADECFFMDKAITDDEMDYLYNAGSGRTYAQLLSDAGY